MTEDKPSTNEGTPMLYRAEQREEKIRIAAEAFLHLKEDDKKRWVHWVQIAEGLDAGRQECMALAGYPNAITGRAGRGYNEAMSRWLKKHDWALAIDAKTRKDCWWLVDNLGVVLAWRETLPINLKLKLNHPTSVHRKFEAEIKGRETKAAKAKGELTGKDKVLADLIKERDDLAAKVKDLEWQLGAEGGGNIFDQGRGKPEDAARILIENAAGSDRLKDWTMQFFRRGNALIDSAKRKKAVG